MNLSEPFIRRPVMTILLMVSLLVFGVISYFRLPVSDLPNIDLPTIEVSVSFPGASPTTMANSVAVPLEQAFMGIEGIQTIFSSSTTGSTSITLTFVLDRNIDAAATDVQSAINSASSNLPSDLPNPPTYSKVNPAATPILYYVVSSPNMTMGELYEYGNSVLGERLSMVNGVAQVLAYGAPYAVRIQIDPEKLAAKKIGLDEIVSLIEQANVDLPLGNLYGPKTDFTIDADGQLFNAAAYSEIIIKNKNGDLVKIKDIGRVLDSIQDDKFFQTYVTKDGEKECIVLSVQNLPGTNAVKIINDIKKTVETLRPQLPKTLTLDLLYDKSDAIHEEVQDVNLTLFVAFCLVVFIVYLSLGKVLNTAIPVLAIPLSICGTLIAMHIFDFSIDILSLLAITLSIGFLIDDAIVVLENNVRHVQMGKSPFEAALVSAKEISITVFSMTLCLTAAFIPMIFMGGVVGRLFRECAVTIIVAVLFSGLISLTLTPMLGSRVVRPYQKEKKGKMEKLSDKANEWLKKIYAPCLYFAMRHRLLMLAIGTLSILGSFLFYRMISKDFLPPDDIGFIQGFTQSRDGTSPFLMKEYHSEICEIAKNDPSVESILSISSFNNANQGILFLKLKPFSERPSMYQVIAELFAKYCQFPGINVYLSPLPLINLTVGTTAQALYQYSMMSIDQKTLFNYATSLTQKMQTNPIFSQVSNDLLNHQPQWSFHILRDKASNYNVTAEAIENFLSWAYSDNKISQINGAIAQYDVIVETLPRFYENPTVLSKLYIHSSTNNLVPLSELVEPKQTAGLLNVNHLNGFPNVNISFNSAPNIALGTALDELKKLTSENFPSQINGQVIGTASIFAGSTKSLELLLLLALFVIYIVLGILYESFIHPITVMSALPPTLFGGLFSLFLFKESLSLYSFIGLILLIGIVLKNGIIMIDFANDAVKKEGKSPNQAIIEACLIRFRPILMTTISAMMGALPIALGVGGAMAKNRASLGICVVGGLIFSQLLTLLLTPVLYYYFEILQEKLRHFIRRWKTGS